MGNLVVTGRYWNCRDSLDRPRVMPAVVYGNPHRANGRIWAVNGSRQTLNRDYLHCGIFQQAEVAGRLREQQNVSEGQDSGLVENSHSFPIRGRFPDLPLRKLRIMRSAETLRISGTHPAAPYVARCILESA